MKRKNLLQQDPPFTKVSFAAGLERDGRKKSAQKKKSESSVQNKMACKIHHAQFVTHAACECKSGIAPEKKYICAGIAMPNSPR